MLIGDGPVNADVSRKKACRRKNITMNPQFVFFSIAAFLVVAFILWGVIYTRRTGKPFIVIGTKDAEPQPKQSPYHRLLDTPAEKLSETQKRDQLSGAISWQNESRINELLSGDNRFLSKPAKYSSETWLGQAVKKKCSIAVLDKLLAAGCDPNGYLESPKETRPLEIAVSDERLDVLKWLLEHGADPNIGRPIVAAIHHEKSSAIQLAILTLLLDAGANINNTFPLFGDESNRFTVLDWAVLYDVSPDVIKFLKRRGASHNWPVEKIDASKRELQPRRIVP